VTAPRLPTSLARFVGSGPARDADLLALRRAAFHQQDILVLRLADVGDDRLRQALIAEGERLYGRRRERGR
jgi:hypothetical protein